MPSQTAAQTAAAPATSDRARITMPGSPFGIANGFLYGYQGASAYEFMPTLRRLGAGFTKTYLFWNQVEPKRGTYDWTAVDAFVNQLKSADEALVGVFSASEWAVTKPSVLLPPSPAKNPDDYYRFIFDLVSHCKGACATGRTTPSPTADLLGWHEGRGSAGLALFHKAVRPPIQRPSWSSVATTACSGSPARSSFRTSRRTRLFDYVFKEGHDAFDVFDLRLLRRPTRSWRASTTCVR